MEREYVSVGYEPASSDVKTAEEALRLGEYTKLYYLADGILGRTDCYAPEAGLLIVRYFGYALPHDQLLREHFAHYPTVTCAIHEPRQPVASGEWLERWTRYNPPGVLERKFELYQNNQGHTVRQLEFDPESRLLGEDRTIWEGDEPIRIETYDERGRYLYCMSFNEGVWIE